MNITPLHNPVMYYDNGSSVHTEKLRQFCQSTSDNFNAVQSEMARLRLRDAELATLNAKLIQFMNWIAVTNPQILDEFQATANAFEKLSPRDAEEYAVPQSAA